MKVLNAQMKTTIDQSVAVMFLPRIHIWPYLPVEPHPW